MWLLECPQARVLEHLRESTCPRVPNTNEIWTAALSSKFSMNQRQIELEKISLCHI